MRIGILAGKTTPEGGGSFTYEESILSALVEYETQHHLYIFCSTPKKSHHNHSRVTYVRVPSSLVGRVMLYGKKAIIAPTIFIIRIVGLFRVFKNKRLIEQLRKSCRSGIDILLEKHSIDVAWSIVPANLLPSETPYFITVWDLQHRITPSFPEVSHFGWGWEARERSYQQSLPRATGIITGTEVGKAEVIDYYQVNPDNVHVIPFPLPDSYITSNIKHAKISAIEKYNLLTPYLFYPAQFWPHKNHITILLALRLLLEKRGIDIHVVFTGPDKGNKKYIFDMARKLGIKDHIHYFGFVPVEDLVSLYENAFALTFPSFFGPDNLPPLEAFSLGCPVIASNIMEEQLGDAALLVDPADEEGWANAVTALNDDPELKNQLIEKGKERVMSWSAEDYAKRALSLFEKFEKVRRCWSSVEPYGSM